jgi:hypothetical protein
MAVGIAAGINDYLYGSEKVSGFTIPATGGGYTVEAGDIIVMVGAVDNLTQSTPTFSARNQGSGHTAVASRWVNLDGNTQQTTAGNGVRLVGQVVEIGTGGFFYMGISLSAAVVAKAFVAYKVTGADFDTFTLHASFATTSGQTYSVPVPVDGAGFACYVSENNALPTVSGSGVMTSPIYTGMNTTGGGAAANVACRIAAYTYANNPSGSA